MSEMSVLTPPDKKHLGGRPLKFTPLTLKRILRCARMGMPLTLCAAAVGVSGMGLIMHRRKFPKFEKALQSNIAKGVSRRLLKIEQAVEAGDWHAAAWWLEHCQPQYFAKNRLEVTGADGAPLAGVVAIMLPPKMDGNVNGNGSSVVVSAPALTEGSRDGNG